MHNYLIETKKGPANRPIILEQEQKLAATALMLAGLLGWLIAGLALAGLYLAGWLSLQITWLFFLGAGFSLSLPVIAIGLCSYLTAGND